MPKHVIGRQLEAAYGSIWRVAKNGGDWNASCYTSAPTELMQKLTDELGVKTHHIDTGNRSQRVAIHFTDVHALAEKIASRPQQIER